MQCGVHQIYLRPHPERKSHYNIFNDAVDDSTSGSEHAETPQPIKAFIRMLEDETQPVQIPSCVRVVYCECNEPCVLREVIGHGYFVWVCQYGSCMICQLLEQEQQQTHPDGFAENGKLLVEKSLNVSQEVAILAPSAGTGESANDLPELPPLDEFWDEIEQEMTVPEEQTAQILSASMEPPKCHCEKLCKFAICNISGSLFWVCSPRKCHFVEEIQNRPAANDLDLGMDISKENVKFTSRYRENYFKNLNSKSLDCFCFCYSYGSKIVFLNSVFIFIILFILFDRPIRTFWTF